MRDANADVEVVKLIAGNNAIIRRISHAPRPFKPYAGDVRRARLITKNYVTSDLDFIPANADRARTIGEQPAAGARRQAGRDVNHVVLDPDGAAIKIDRPPRRDAASQTGIILPDRAVDRDVRGVDAPSTVPQVDTLLGMARHASRSAISEDIARVHGDHVRLTN